MGIQGLLPALKSIAVQTHVKHYGEQTLGVDAYVWLHRGAISCAWNLALGRPTTKYVDYAMHRVKMLQHYGVTPYVVFDGDFLPSKARTEQQRAAKRAENLKLGKEHMARGDTKAAQDFFQKAIDITPEMALRFIRALQANNIDYVVAPYEADAQLAYLERIGLIDGIVTEDSDLLVFGCKKVLFKMNEFGECTEISSNRFGDNKELSLVGWNVDMFRYMAILSGCDYLASVPGMGLKSAHRLVKRYKTLEKIMRGLRAEMGLRMPVDYEENFRRADMTFLFQYIYCPLKKSLIMGHEASGPLDEETKRLIGSHLADDIARAVAEGSIDPITKKKILLADPAGLRRYSTKYSAVAPQGNMLMDQFVQPATTTKAAVLSERSVNEQVPLSSPEAMAKRLAPRPSLREQAQAKKLKLFDSSPSPPRDRIPKSPDRPEKEEQSGKENKISPFFSLKGAKKATSRADNDLAKAIEASMIEEERRKSFAGFQNPVAFEVRESEKLAVTSRHFMEACTPSQPAVPSLCHESSTEPDAFQLTTGGLPTPPNSQNLDAVVAGWREKYSCVDMSPSPAIRPVTSASKARPPLIRASTSISRMGGKALNRSASTPGLAGSVQRRPFFPHSSSLSQPDASRQRLN